MNDFVTIATFTFPGELAIIRARLESEGIECRTKDELTVQVHNFYSNAIGGVKLQVRPQDMQKTAEILEDFNYHVEPPGKISPQWTKLDEITSGLPLLGTMEFERRLYILVFLTIVVLAILITFLLALLW